MWLELFEESTAPLSNRMVWFARSTAADESHTYRSRTPSEKKNHLALAKYVQTVDDSIASFGWLPGSLRKGRCRPACRFRGERTQSDKKERKNIGYVHCIYVKVNIIIIILYYYYYSWAVSKSMGQLYLVIPKRP